MIPSISSVPPALERAQRMALLVAGAAAAACAIGLFLSPGQLLRSSLTAYVFWVGIALGCMGILMLQHLTGGGWGIVLRRILEAGAASLPWMALLFVPLAVSLASVYPWARPEAVAADPALQQKQAYLN